MSAFMHLKPVRVNNKMIYLKLMQDQRNVAEELRSCSQKAAAFKIAHYSPLQCARIRARAIAVAMEIISGAQISHYCLFTVACGLGRSPDQCSGSVQSLIAVVLLRHSVLDWRPVNQADLQLDVQPNPLVGNWNCFLVVGLTYSP